MEFKDIDPEKIRIIADNIAPHAKSSDEDLGHLAAQLIQLCNVLTGDDVEIIDPRKTPPFDQDAAMARAATAARTAVADQLRQQ